ncbi:DNA replication initiation control protein YabA [Pediococcus argentinicus]|uniref:Initiation-control protein yabA n=1 Tax=Pediococcus argentinicus TaxID=480391 RepID=A0A0R2NJ06_9LACO|nr:DNA replication initiation control protein YabA [Pediococcus argentinicus]KRO25769.1 initiation-control protein yabA [Pediococcus argentinicus]NKZ21935.1 DNA replication initiation control protein YabA [Pediococcus argentinicus]GEP19104.1 initiation-control protein YabA [Pediococcus argentinicus]
MAEQDLYAELSTISQEAAALLERLQQVQNSMVDVLEENAELKIENQHLRERLEQVKDNDKKNQHNTKHGLSKSRKNLEKLYASGYHICNEWFGKHRKNDEECAFCLTVIYGDR